MSGHSKWSTIKHKKGAADAKRGQAFTKLIKEITIAARLGGGDPNANPRLRLLLEKAKEINMPIDNSTRAIKRGTGELPGMSYEEMTYEGYGPHGIAVIVDALTDNKNRTVSELRHLFSVKGGNLSESGSVQWMFDRTSVVRAQGENMSEEKLLEELIDFDVNDIRSDGDTYEIFCDPKSNEPIKNKLEQLGMKIKSADLEFVAKDLMNLPENDATKAYEFLEALEEHDDVKNVYTNVA